ncbi:hypothetical protein GOC74_04385 [Halomicrobium mukohataei]|uniref:Uncharacterized protein n=1 Tax=Halomicrobium mukohataei TaxID=57705 RepID=A0A847U9G3_9EURY|nr:hypothetical protein [Halomicrobium mukohataei]NLV09166.1 hypothetical protein [Halomicrobium mukohataei]
MLNTAAVFVALFVYKPSAQVPYLGTTLIIAVALAIMGGVPAYLSLRYRLATPVAWCGLLTTLSLIDQSGMMPFANLYANPIVIIYTLGIAVVLGVVEYYIRGWVPFLSHEPLV